jgi:phage-related protein
MAWDTFSPPQNPSQDGYSVSTTARLLSSTFGDGYVQRTPDGLNYVGSTVSLSWAEITQAHWTSIQAFLDAHNAVPFLYQLPSASAVQQWSCSAYKLGAFDGKIWYGNSLTLTQDFTPAP